MAKKKQTEVIKEVKREFILVPNAWMERLIALAYEEGAGAQHLKGYIASAEAIVLSGKKVDEETYHTL